MSELNVDNADVLATRAEVAGGAVRVTVDDNVPPDPLALLNALGLVHNGNVIAATRHVAEHTPLRTVLLVSGVRVVLTRV